ncbi:hypothetical protein K501DRAFT_265324 [Backusella circina FSU 941]|nr:hypothetical protein K501DRAFT_265324 [Backusella circina FSU 941]
MNGLMRYGCSRGTRSIKGWIQKSPWKNTQSSFEYEQTIETFGITALPLEIMREYNIRLRITEMSKKGIVQAKKSRLLETSLHPVIQVPIKGSSSSEFMYNYLAECQKTEPVVRDFGNPQDMNIQKYCI